jgi:hypothetical protein
MKKNQGVNSMKKQVLIIGIVILLIFVAFSGCNSSTEPKSTTDEKSTTAKKIIGQWKITESDDTITTYNFFNNGSVYLSFYVNTNDENNFWNTYTLTENNLLFGNGTHPYEVSYTDNYQKLILTDLEDNSNRIFERQ